MPSPTAEEMSANLREDGRIDRPARRKSQISRELAAGESASLRGQRRAADEKAIERARANDSRFRDVDKPFDNTMNRLGYADVEAPSQMRNKRGSVVYEAGSN